MQNQKIEIAEEEISYYLREGSGIFAYALSEIYKKGKIYILSDIYGEDWNDDIPYEVTHVYFSPNEHLIIDAKGHRTEISMAKDFLLSRGQYRIIGGFDPNDFRKNFMGSSKKFPLFGKKSDIILANNLIKKYASFYLLGNK